MHIFCQISYAGACIGLMMRMQRSVYSDLGSHCGVLFTLMNRSRQDICILLCFDSSFCSGDEIAVLQLGMRVSCMGLSPSASGKDNVHGSATARPRGFRPNTPTVRLDDAMAQIQPQS